MANKGQKLADKLDITDEYSLYWTDGQVAYYRIDEIKGADIATFEQFAGSWAKDKKHCYSGGARLQNADVDTFEVLNFTYAKDKSSVWTLGGRIADADAETFMVCDNGRHSLGKKKEVLPDGTIKIYEEFVPYGYGKDKNHVYYYGFTGKPSIVRKAIAATFVSMNDGDHFGYDEASVFHEKTALPKANPKTWKKLSNGFYYSQDCEKIYYFNRLMKDADTETFTVISTPYLLGGRMQLAKDKNNYYWNDRIISKEDFEKYTDMKGTAVITDIGKDKLTVINFLKNKLNITPQQALTLSKQSEIIVAEGFSAQLKQIITHLETLGATVVFKPES